MDTKNAGLFTFAGIAALLLCIYLLLDLPSAFEKSHNDKQSQSVHAAHNEMKNLDDALNKRIVRDTFQYVGSFESPFRKLGDDLAKKSASANVPVRPTLFLKGILLKNEPLAILEDEQGETYIEGVGQIVLGQEIVKINDNKVTLRDSRGKYDLVVEEN